MFLTYFAFGFQIHMVFHFQTIFRCRHSWLSNGVLAKIKFTLSVSNTIVKCAGNKVNSVRTFYWQRSVGNSEYAKHRRRSCLRQTPRRCTISLRSAKSKQLSFRKTNKRLGRGRSFGFLTLYDGPNDSGGSSCRQYVTVTRGTDVAKKPKAVNGRSSNCLDSAQRPPTYGR